MEDSFKIFRVPEDFVDPAERADWKGLTLENGVTLGQYHLAYTTYGTLSAEGDNVVWIFHALTANSQPAEWWDGLVGPGRFFDPERYFIVCVNTPGSCYGSISPLDNDPDRGEPYWHRFPYFTTRDLIRSYQPLRRHLGIRKIHMGIGGSMGGQQLLEWAIEEPWLFDHIVPIATNAQHSAFGIAFNTSQRMAIEADTTWQEQHPQAGIAGMKVARSIALISYRSYEGYQIKQANNASQWFPQPEGESRGGAASYQRYQGEKLAKRFNAFSYYTLTHTMDSHNVGRGRGSVAEALKHIRAKTLVIGIDSDVLFPLSEQEFLAAEIPGARLVTLQSHFGHDGFLLEFAALSQHLEIFLQPQPVHETQPAPVQSHKY